MEDIIKSERIANPYYALFLARWSWVHYGLVPSVNIDLFVYVHPPLFHVHTWHPNGIELASPTFF